MEPRGEQMSPGSGLGSPNPRLGRASGAPWRQDPRRRRSVLRGPLCRAGSGLTPTSWSCWRKHGYQTWQEGTVNRVFRSLCSGQSSPVGRVPSPDARTHNRLMPASGAQTANAGSKGCRRRASPSVSRPCFLGTGPPVRFIGCRLRTRLRDRSLGPQVPRLNDRHRGGRGRMGVRPLGSLVRSDRGGGGGVGGVGLV